jgi:hypothetical protein
MRTPKAREAAATSPPTKLATSLGPTGMMRPMPSESRKSVMRMKAVVALELGFMDGDRTNRPDATRTSRSALSPPAARCGSVTESERRRRSRLAF